jgi:hypothetical protein
VPSVSAVVRLRRILSYRHPGVPLLVLRDESNVGIRLFGDSLDPEGKNVSKAEDGAAFARASRRTRASSVRERSSANAGSFASIRPSAMPFDCVSASMCRCVTPLVASTPKQKSQRSLALLSLRTRVREFRTALEVA